MRLSTFFKNNLYDDDNDDEKYIKTKKPEMRKLTHVNVFNIFYKKIYSNTVIALTMSNKLIRQKPSCLVD